MTSFELRTDDGSESEIVFRIGNRINYTRRVDYKNGNLGWAVLRVGDEVEVLLDDKGEADIVFIT